MNLSYKILYLIYSRNERVILESLEENDQILYYRKVTDKALWSSSVSSIRNVTQEEIKKWMYIRNLCSFINSGRANSM